jgi:hypothetical protein
MVLKYWDSKIVFKNIGTKLFSRLTFITNTHDENLGKLSIFYTRIKNWNNSKVRKLTKMVLLWGVRVRIMVFNITFNNISMAVTTLRQMRQMPHTEIEDFFIQRFYLKNKTNQDKLMLNSLPSRFWKILIIHVKTPKKLWLPKNYS